MSIKLSLVFALAGVVRLSATEAPSALEALKFLPPGAAEQLAMIDGHDGAPAPERWHFLVQDDAAENGFREFVVADGDVVADRQVSQFATAVTPAEVVGKAALKVDSTTVARLVERYAAANEVPVVSMNFRLRKDELTGRPVWVVGCRDAQDASLATLVVDGLDARVLGHEGFAVAPPPPAPLVRPSPKRLASAAGSSWRRSDDSRSDGDLPPPVYEGPRDRDGEIPVRRAEAVKRPHLPNPINDVRNLLHRLLPF